MTWNNVELCDVLQASESYMSLLNLSQYKYAVLSHYPNGLFLEGRKRGADFRGKQHQIVRAGQFVISNSGIDQRLWGIVPSDLDEAVVHKSYLCFDIHYGINSRYFAAYVATKQFNANVSAARTRTGQLSIRQFTNIKMPHPPLEEQLRIAAIWESTGRALHHAVEEYRSIVELKSDIAAQLFQKTADSVQPKALASWATIERDEDVHYPVYLTLNGQPYKGKPRLADEAIGIMPNPELDSQFLYYYLENQKQLAQTSSNYPRHNLETVIERLPLALPTLYEQRKIVTLLQQHDEALEKLEVEQNELRQLAQGVIELVFSGKMLSQEALSLLQSY
jgi:hypothetical protein